MDPICAECGTDISDDGGIFCSPECELAYADYMTSLRSDFEEDDQRPPRKQTNLTLDAAWAARPR